MNSKLDLTPAVLDLILYAGDGEDFQISFVDDNGTAIDISSFTWNSQIRKTRSAEDAIDLDIDVTDAVAGNLTLHISADITRALPTRSQWDLQCVSIARPDPRSFVQGSVSCVQDVTRVPV